MTTPRQVIDDYVLESVAAGRTISEERIRTLLRPKPRWVHYRLWAWFLRRLLTIEIERIHP